jgi:hypothetical protein
MEQCFQRFYGVIALNRVRKVVGIQRVLPESVPDLLPVTPNGDIRLVAQLSLKCGDFQTVQGAPGCDNNLLFVPHFLAFHHPHGFVYALFSGLPDLIRIATATNVHNDAGRPRI